MDFRLIKSPSVGTKNVLSKRMNGKFPLDYIDAVGLVQGKVIDMVYAIDIAEKAAGVIVEDIGGVCPQHMVLIAIFGDTSSVEAAIDEIKHKMKEGGI